MCVFKRRDAWSAASGSGTSAEEVNLAQPGRRRPTPSSSRAGASSGSTPFKLHTWLLGSAAAGNMTVTAPAAAIIGSTGTINLTFSGLTAGTKYLGSVAYGGVGRACRTRRSSAWTSPRPAPAGGSAAGSTQREAPGDAGGLARSRGASASAGGGFSHQRTAPPLAPAR